jgi:uncharacterized protein
MGRSVIGRAIGLALLLVALLARSPLSAQTNAPLADEIAAFTSLHAVTWSGAHNEIRQLLVNGIDPNLRDAKGRTPFLLAAHRGDIIAMRLLVEGGADPRAKDASAYDAVTIAAVLDKLPALSAALQLGGDPRAITSPWQGTALIAAAHAGHPETVRVLIEAGAPLDHVNSLGWTALIEAIVLGDGGRRYQRIVTLLLNSGADPNLADRNGANPLALAKSRGFNEIANLLAAKGGR